MSSETNATAATPQGDLWQCIAAWWRSLESDSRGRAELRRAESIVDAYFSVAFHRLLADVRRSDNHLPYKQDGLACAALVLAHVEVDVGDQSLGTYMGDGREGPRVSELRFRRVLKSEDHEELFSAFRRIVRLLNRASPVHQLARTTVWWTPATRKNLAIDYYQTAKLTRSDS